MVRIAIYPDYGSIYISKEGKDYINSRKDVNWRVSLAEYIDSLGDTHSNISQEVYDNFVNSKDMQYIKSKDLFFFKDLEEKFGLVYRVKVVDVDNSKKWMISEYDGAEDIDYFSEPVLVDKELNMYRW
jgi:hypothetical protein